jgi:4-hydroxy-3-polyprenylbenzoate decarboxylase
LFLFETKIYFFDIIHTKMNKIIIAITGASGSIYAKVLLDKLASIKSQWSDLGIVITDNAKLVWQTELGEIFSPKYEASYFEKNDFMAPFASGSGNFNTMIIVPCSMGTVGRIAGGISNDLISRAADVILKERRKLICVVRETPYSLIHLKNMETITQAGGIICPATPSFYSKPATIEEVVATVADRIIDLAGLKIDTFRWGQ